MDSPSTPESIEPTQDLTFTHHGHTHEISIPSSATVADLAAHISDLLSVPISNQKLLVSKLGMLKPPFSTSTPASTLSDKKIQLLAPLPSDLASLTASRFAVRQRAPRSTTTAAAPTRRVTQQEAQARATYTFHNILPLPYLPNPQRSHDYLVRLANDPGIRASMTKHKFSVGTLTEMNPAEHTTHESRTLGLNRNRGEVIELRLRTDAYDGYRDYKTIRKTLCHELAHNVWGEHDRNFWDLCKAIESEVERGDWKSGGRALTGQEFYEPPGGGRAAADDDDWDHVDGGGWTGGEFVVGGGSALGTAATTGLSRRELMAKAAEERAKKAREIGRGHAGGDEAGTSADGGP